MEEKKVRINFLNSAKHFSCIFRQNLMYGKPDILLLKQFGIVDIDQVVQYLIPLEFEGI
jgi:hypothetical protein